MDSVETYVCLRCQKGYVPVKGSDGKSVVQCVCPPGTFQNNTATPKTCVPCTTGSFCPGGDPKARKPTDNIGGNPMSCNANNSTGLTTKSERSTRRADCIAQAGYVLPATAGAAAQECTGSTYAPAFNRLRTCLPCQSGLAAPLDYTGAHDDKLAVCQVPPGKFWELNVVRDCPKGLYREEFVRTDNKTSIACKSCPEGWTTKNIGTPLKSLCNVLLPGYQAGWGITFDPSDFTKFKAIKPCPANTYGVANTTYGLINAPCKACTKNLYSLEASTNFTACLNPGGFGYTSEGANQCPDGFWAAKDSMAPCEQCPEGRTTLYVPGNGTFQDAIEDCIVAPGSGVFNGSDTNPWSPTDPTNPNTPAKQCPIGFYTNNDTLATSNTCQACPNHGSTTAPGSTSCTVCAAGYGSGFALRGGESWLGGRSFFVSPDGNGAAGVAGPDMNALAW
ncbi:hypothetical protein OEZ85_004397 [Tetradesmus obliquus]|uniref:Tyrosine-protein kinase ephrin type A/B receptor-like domain-containing protein n=1 Tax=Tetradesmus obliquus TaxID=3088 RepID=A0ABY8UP51_TETOB|nr:hypothetical protein OEZ85_004397 [Tetradesmus obliquus]